MLIKVAFILMMISCVAIYVIIIIVLPTFIVNNVITNVINLLIMSIM